MSFFGQVTSNRPAGYRGVKNWGGPIGGGRINTAGLAANNAAAASFNAGRGYTINGPGVSSGGGATGGSWSSGGGTGPGFGGDIGGLINKQLAENEWAKNANINEWNLARAGLQSAGSQYWSDPLTQASRANALDTIQNYKMDPQIAINRASNLINAAGNAGYRAQLGQLAASGQLNSAAANQAFMQNEALRRNQLANTAADVTQQYEQANFARGLQANQQASGLAQQGFGNNFNVANSIASLRPQYQADDLSGLIATLGFAGGGGMGGVGGGAPGYGGSSADYGMYNSDRVPGSNPAFGMGPSIKTPMSGGYDSRGFSYGYDMGTAGVPGGSFGSRNADAYMQNGSAYDLARARANQASGGGYGGGMGGGYNTGNPTLDSYLAQRDSNRAEQLNRMKQGNIDFLRQSQTPTWAPGGAGGYGPTGFTGFQPNRNAPWRSDSLINNMGGEYRGGMYLDEHAPVNYNNIRYNPSPLTDVP